MLIMAEPSGFLFQDVLNSRSLPARQRSSGRANSLYKILEETLQIKLLHAWQGTLTFRGDHQELAREWALPTIKLALGQIDAARQKDTWHGRRDFSGLFSSGCRKLFLA
jgi:hypothetical protein